MKKMIENNSDHEIGSMFYYKSYNKKDIFLLLKKNESIKEIVIVWINFSREDLKIRYYLKEFVYHYDQFNNQQLVFL